MQERQALLLKKKEVPKIQMQQKLLEVPEEVKTKVTEKLHLEMAEVKKLKETDLTPERESNEERYWEEEKRKRDNFTSSEDYNFYVEKEMEEAKRAKTRMCSVDKIPTTTSTSINNGECTDILYMKYHIYLVKCHTLNRHIPKLRNCHGNILPFSLGQ